MKGTDVKETTAGNDRIVAVVQALVERTEATGVRELAEMLGASRSTVNRILLGLAEHDFALATSNGSYRTGPRLRVLAAALHARHPVLSRTGEIIDSLSERADATVIVALHDAPRPQVVVVACRRRPGPIRYLLEPGTVVPLHAGATGRSILGRIGLDALGDQPLESRTSDTVTDRHELERLLDQDRRAGYTISIGQQFQLAAGAAAPFQCLGLTGSISITRPRYLTSDEDLDRFGPMARDAAQATEKTCAQSRVSVEAQSPIGYPAGSTALERIIRLITLLVTQPTGVSAGPTIAHRIVANVATADRLVSTAVAAGLALVENGIVRPGPRLLQWAGALGPAIAIVPLTQHILRDLAETTGETVGLADFNPGTREAEMVEVINGVQPLNYGLASGVTIPLHAGAAGKAILAHCPPGELDRLRLEPVTERTQTNRDALAADLQAIRERGWATAEGERIPDAFGVSAPYFIDGEIAGSLTVTVARFRLPDLDIEGLAQAVQRAAHRITRLLSVTGKSCEVERVPGGMLPS